MKIVILCLLCAELLYICIMLYMYLMQRRILFVPEKDLWHPSHYGLDKTEDIILNTIDDVQIGCWYQPPQDKVMPYIVYFHGNAGHLRDRVDKLKTFLDYGFGICAPSYRGYGTSEGHPTEEGLYNDARAAVAFLKAKGVPEGKMVLYGESLGSGIATQIATECHEAKALVLEAPYTSTADRGRERYPWLPVYLLMKDWFDSLSKIPKIHLPLLIFHGAEDTTIPQHHGKQLLKAGNTPKKGIFLPKIDHTNFDPAKLSQTILKFLENPKA